MDSSKESRDHASVQLGPADHEASQAGWIKALARLQDLREELRELTGEIEARVREGAPLSIGTVQDLSAVTRTLEDAAFEVQQEAARISEARHTLGDARRGLAGRLDGANDGYLVTNHLGMIQEANQTVARFLRHPLNQIIGRPLATFVALEDRRAFRARLNYLAQVDESEEWLLRLMPRDGSQILLAVTAIPFSDGHPQKLLQWNLRASTNPRMEGILARSRMNSALANLSQRALVSTDLRAVEQEAAELVAATLGVDHTYVVEVLPGREEMLLSAGIGWKPGQVGYAWVAAGEGSQAGFTVVMQEPVVATDLLRETRFTVSPLIREAGLVSGATVLIAGRGGSIGVLGALSRERRVFSLDELHFMQSMANTIGQFTERYRAEQALAESEERYRQLAEVAPDGILVTVDGKCRYANPAAARLLGLAEPSEVLGRRPLEFVHEAFHETIRKRLDMVQRHGVQVPAMEQTILRPDGTTAETEVISSPYTYQGRPAVLVIVRDISARRQAERELRESEERYRSLVELSPEAIFVHQDGKYVFANRATVDLYGAAGPEDLLGRSPMEMIHPDYRPLLARYVEHLEENQEPVHLLEEKALRIDGQVIDIETVGTPITYQGRPARQVMARNVTARKQAEEALRESEERFRNLVAQAPIGVIIHQSDRLLFANPVALRILGVQGPDGLLEKPPTDFVAQDEWDRVQDHFRRVANSGHSGTPEVFTVLSLDGTRKQVEASSVLSEFQGEPAIQTLLQDVTARIQAEQALRESEERYRALVELSPEPIFVHEDGVYVYLNQAMCALFGAASPDELIGRRLVDFIHPDSQDGVREYMRPSGERRGPVSLLELDMLRLDGSAVRVEAVGSPIVYGGRPARQVMLRDVTERRSLEDEVIQKSRALAVLEERERMAREFHDTLAQGFTGVILQAQAADDLLVTSPDEARVHLHRAWNLARESLKETRDVIAGLLPAALESGSLRTAILSEVQRFVRLGNEGTSFTTSGRERATPVHVQEALLRICRESLANARKHSNATKVTVHLAYDEAAVTLEVCDNGIGFDTERARDGRRGHGLVGMQERAHEIGGSVSIESSRETGTKVRAVFHAP